jgi:peptidoglycan/xylan/chitin deacetylase (PgdA/CDA1 family)
MKVALLFSVLVSMFWGMNCCPVAQAASVAITMDDFDIHEQTMLTAQERNKRILATLNKHRAKAALFVIGQNIQTNDDRALLRQWPLNGHFIGNHTFDHKPYNSKMSLEMEEQEILACEKILSGEAGFQKIFRFPMLAEGNTPEKRDALRAWLKTNGYKVGSVTIDASDWYIDQRLRDKLATDPKADLTPYRDYYLAHIWDRAQYYNNVSKKVLGREVKHTLLVHFNLLNALFLDDLLSMFESKGWKIINAQDAFQDPVFDRLPNSMPSGQSLIWGLAKETGKYDQELRYPGEDDTYEKPKMDALGL